MNIQVIKMIRSLPKIFPKKVYPCKGGLYPTCICLEYLDFGKEEHRKRYKNCFITSMKDVSILTKPN
jgi:hypothetical protein